MARLPTAITAAVKQRKSVKEIIDYKYALDQSSIVAITQQKCIILYAMIIFVKFLNIRPDISEKKKLEAELFE